MIKIQFIEKLKKHLLDLKLIQKEKCEARKLLLIENRIDMYLNRGKTQEAENIFMEYSDDIIDGYLEYSSVIYYREDDLIDKALRKIDLTRSEMAERLKELLEKFGINYI